MPAVNPLRVARRDDGRVIAGVAAGLGAYFGIEANLLRVAFVVLSLAGGLGVALYGIAWLLMGPPAEPEGPRRRAPDIVQAAALGAVVLGLLLLARASGTWFGDAIVWPLAAAGVGLGILWMQPRRADDGTEGAWPALDRLPPAAAQAVTILVGTRRGAYVRVVIGSLLMAGGIFVLVASSGSWSALRVSLSAALVVTIGLVFVLGPGLWRLASALARERRERIRADERADMAAHLHDSVLQTLALVQRRADDPREVVRLARMQERELRAWLLQGENGAPGSDAFLDSDVSLGTALERAAELVEREYGTPIEVVRVRDCPITGLEPLLLAAKEGIVNAARHSGAPSVSVFLEVDQSNAVVYVRDRGRGFDPQCVNDDRGGLANSVVGRLTRRGGEAHIHSAPGAGTELELLMPRKQVSDV